MSEESERLTTQQQRAREALRSVKTPPADPSFRDRLKHAFMTGTIKRPNRTPDLSRPTPSRGSALEGLRHALWGRMAWAVGATAMLVVVLTLNRGPAWELSVAMGQGVAVVDGRSIPLGHIEDLASRLGSGSRVIVPAGGEIELRSPGVAAIYLAPGTDATIPPVPGRWFGRNVSGQIRAGIARITTGPAFRGARMVIGTPEADVEVSGTTLAVICEPEGTCVCVLEGKVEVTPRGRSKATVEQGKRRFIYNDGRPSLHDTIRETEAAQLAAFREAMAPQRR